MVEVQDIIKKYGKEYKEKHKILPHVAKGSVKTLYVSNYFFLYF